MVVELLKPSQNRVPCGSVSAREFNRELNAALQATVDVVAQCLIADGRCKEKVADRPAVLLVSAVFGILHMDKTGRPSTLQQDSSVLVAEQIATL